MTSQFVLIQHLLSAQISDNCFLNVALILSHSPPPKMCFLKEVQTEYLKDAEFPEVLSDTALTFCLVLSVFRCFVLPAGLQLTAHPQSHSATLTRVFSAYQVSMLLFYAYLCLLMHTGSTQCSEVNHICIIISSQSIQQRDLLSVLRMLLTVT